MPTKRSSDLFARIKAATFCDPFRRGRESCDGPGAARALSESGKGFVLLNEWGVFPSGERMHIFERLRLSYGIAEPLIDKCGHELTHQEFEDTSSLVTLAVLFLWDCYVLTPSGKPALWFSHDEVGYG